MNGNLLPGIDQKVIIVPRVFNLTDTDLICSRILGQGVVLLTFYFLVKKNLRRSTLKKEA